MNSVCKTFAVLCILKLWNSIMTFTTARILLVGPYFVNGHYNNVVLQNMDAYHEATSVIVGLNVY